MAESINIKAFFFTLNPMTALLPWNQLLTVTVQILIGILVGYATTVYSEFLIHRNIWHGRWKIVHHGLFHFLLYPHYVQHFKAHHLHAHKFCKHFEAGAIVPEESRKQIEEFYLSQPNVLNALRCSDHGITMKGIRCILHFWVITFFTPQPYVVIFLWVVLSPAAGIPALLIQGFSILTYIFHRFYHMSKQTCIKHAPRWLQWVVRSKVFRRLVEEHQKHHHEALFKDDYYSLLPLGNYLLRKLSKIISSTG
jgi:hypothetical protein